MLAVVSSVRVRCAALRTLIGLVLTLIPLISFAAGNITLAWDPVPSVAGYNLYYGTASRVYPNMLAAGNTTTITVSNLAIGTAYYFAATAYDTFGIESDFSVEVSGNVSVPVNQPPTLDPIASVTLNENAGAQTVNLSGISSGASNEIQTLTVTASSSNPSLVPNPAVNYTSPGTGGVLTFAPVAMAFGSATITVTVNDGGTSNNVISRSFTVTVNPVNQPPTLDPLANLTINENSGVQTVNLSGISSGASNEIQTLTVTASSSNPSVVPNPTVNYTSPSTGGVLTFAPVAMAFGSATITVTVNDGGASNNVVSRSFAVTVSPVNQPPTLDPLANLTINENSGVQTVNLSGISSGASNEIQTLTVTASSSNPSLVPNPTVNYTSPSTGGVLTFAPVAMAFGSATITVTVNDGGASNNIISRSFAVTVSPVNQPPTLNPLANLTINENSGVQTVNLSGISSGANNELQTLVVTAISSNPGVIPNPAVNYTSPSATGFLTFAPVTSALGSATLTVTVNDGGTSNNIVSRSFTVTINSLPTISAMTNLVIAVNTATPLIPFTIGDVETAASNLTVSASSDNAALVQSANIALGGADTNRTITITPITAQIGIANITVSVSDGIGTANSVFLLSVEPKPGRPGNLRIVGNP
jgi:hypothetical protein